MAFLLGDAANDYAIAISHLNDWLSEAEQTLDAEMIQISDEKILKEQRERYCELREALASKQSNIDYVITMKEGLSQK